MTRLSDLLVTKETFTSNMYREFLGNSKYTKSFWDDFKDKASVIATPMIYTYNGFSFTANQTIESINVIDPEISGYEVSECFVTVDHTDSGIGSIYVTANGGVDWEEVSNNTIHKFVNTGTDLRIRFVSGSTGTIKSWALLYKPDAKSYVEELVEGIPKTTGGAIEVVASLPVWSIDYVGVVVYVSTESKYYAGTDKWIELIPKVKENVISNSELGCFSASNSMKLLRTISENLFEAEWEFEDWFNTSENSALVYWYGTPNCMVLSVTTGSTTDKGKASFIGTLKANVIYKMELEIYENTVPGQIVSIYIGNWPIADKAVMPNESIQTFYFVPMKDGEELSIFVQGDGTAGPYGVSIDTIRISEYGPQITSTDTIGIDGGWGKGTKTGLVRDYITDADTPNAVYCVSFSPVSGGEGSGEVSDICMTYPNSERDAYNKDWLIKVVNQKITFGIYIFASAPVVRTHIAYKLPDNSIVKETSADHVGDSSWQWVEISTTIPSNAISVYAEIDVDDTITIEEVKIANPMIVIGDSIGEGNYKPMPNDSPKLNFEVYSFVDSNLISDPWEYIYYDMQVLTNGVLPYNVKSFYSRLVISDTGSSTAFYNSLDFFDEYDEGMIGSVSIAGIANGKMFTNTINISPYSSRLLAYPQASGINTMRIHNMIIQSIDLRS